MLYNQTQTQNIHQETFAFLLVEEKDHILTLTLNRPRKKNALSPTLMKEIAFALAYAHYQQDIWAVVVAANGDTFCAGADLKAFMGIIEPDNSSIPDPEGEVLLAQLFKDLHKPCIAKVQGNAYAGAFLILANCTHVVAKEGVLFGLPEVKRGLYPFQVMAGLLQIMPSRKVLDWCIRGYNLTTDEAERWGLLTMQVAENELDTAVSKLANEITANAPKAIRMGLESFQKMQSLAAQEEQAYLKKMLNEVLESKDAKEGLAAFKEKRSPMWTGE